MKRFCLGSAVRAAIIATIVAYHVFFFEWHASGDLVRARTMTFVTSVVFELCLVMTCRSRRSLFEIGFFSNPFLLFANLFSFGILLFVLYSPLAPYFHAVPLSLEEWILPFGWGIGNLLFFEAWKLLRGGEFHRDTSISGTSPAPPCPSPSSSHAPTAMRP